jgi:hypothetical protein
MGMVWPNFERKGKISLPRTWEKACHMAYIRDTQVHSCQITSTPQNTLVYFPISRTAIYHQHFSPSN